MPSMTKSVPVMCCCSVGEKKRKQELTRVLPQNGLVARLGNACYSVRARDDSDVGPQHSWSGEKTATGKRRALSQN